MRHTLFIGILILSWCGLCFAQAGKPVAAPVVAKVAVVKVLTGTIDSVTVADPVKATKSEIVVVDESAKKTSFLVKSTTTIYDADLKATTLDKLSKDQKVKVKYTTTKEGIEEATAVYVVK